MDQPLRPAGLLACQGRQLQSLHHRALWSPAFSEAIPGCLVHSAHLFKSSQQTASTILMDTRKDGTMGEHWTVSQESQLCCVCMTWVGEQILLFPWVMVFLPMNHNTDVCFPRQQV